MKYNDAFEKTMACILMPNTADAVDAEPIFINPNLPPRIQEIIAEATKTCLDMRVPNPDDPWEEEDAQEPIISSAPQQEFAEEQEKAAQALAKRYSGKPHEEIRGKFPGPLGERVIAILQSQAPTLRQAIIKRDLAIRTANAEFGKALRANGAKSHQHTTNDFTHVISTQLDQWALGNAPSVSEVLRLAFPDDPAKAKSLRGSTRVGRWKDAYNSDVVQNHPMEIAIRLTHDQSGINGRLTARNFGQSLGINTQLFKSSSRLAKQDAEIAQLKRELAHLIQQMESTKCREMLADAGLQTSEERVFDLYRQGKMQTEIAKLLNMGVDAVKYHLKKLPKHAKSRQRKE